MKYEVSVHCSCESDLNITIEDGDLVSVVGILNNFLTNHKHQEKSNAF